MHLASGDSSHQGQGDPSQAPSAMRADARRNRELILDAAEQVFAESGLVVPIDDIARRAGVGVGTLYRHFPTKEALFEAIIVARIQRLATEARALAANEDPGGALFHFLARLGEEGTAKRDLVDALSGAGVNVMEALSGAKKELERAGEMLLHRAQQAGVVRADVGLADLFALVMGTCNGADVGPALCSRARMMAVVCDGLRAEGVHHVTAEHEVAPGSSAT